MEIETRGVTLVTRRSFLKAAGAAGLLATMGIDLGLVQLVEAARWT